MPDKPDNRDPVLLAAMKNKPSDTPVELVKIRKGTSTASVPVGLLPDWEKKGFSRDVEATPVDKAKVE